MKKYSRVDNVILYLKFLKIRDLLFVLDVIVVFQLLIVYIDITMNIIVLEVLL